MNFSNIAQSLEIGKLTPIQFQTYVGQQLSTIKTALNKMEDRLKALEASERLFKMLHNQQSRQNRRSKTIIPEEPLNQIKK